MSRIILHLDMDAFFASIEERENPQLRGRPVVVGADPKGGRGRGVVSTANYEARKYGIHSAMPISKAWKLCPASQCAYLPVDMPLYDIVSQRIMKIVSSFVIPRPLAEESHTLPSARDEISRLPRHGGGSARNDRFGAFEQVSIDEAYVEVANHELGIMNHENTWKEAERLGRKIKHAILRQERLTCSVGIGPNKLIAKIASDFEKPDGLTIVRPEKVQEFLDPLPVRKLPGIGPKTEAELARKGVKTVFDLRISTLPESELWRKASGVDESPVVEEYEAKSIGHETTFEKDTNNQAVVTRTILELADEVLGEARGAGVLFRTVGIRVRFDNFETHTSAHTLKKATADDTILKREALRLLFPYFRKKRLIRLIGLRVSHLKERG